MNGTNRVLRQGSPIMKPLLIVALSLVPSLALQAAPQKAEALWPGGAPGALGSGDEDRPSLTIYLPGTAESAGLGVVVCPGGGYRTLAMDHEGRQVAEWLNSLGIAAFVLRYRLGPRYHHPVEMRDGQRAVRLVRFHAHDFGIAADRIGI